MCICVCMYACINISIYVGVIVNLYMYVYICVCMCLYVWVYMYVCVRACFTRQYMVSKSKPVTQTHTLSIYSFINTYLQREKGSFFLSYMDLVHGDYYILCKMAFQFTWNEWRFSALLSLKLDWVMDEQIRASSSVILLERTIVLLTYWLYFSSVGDLTDAGMKVRKCNM